VNRSIGWPVRWWPAALDPSENVAVVGVEHAEAGPGPQRDAARERIRVVLRAALGQLGGVAPEAIMIQSRPGFAPAVSYSGASLPPPGVAITHDGPLSLAAIRHAGPVGIDVMRVQELPDWRTVARDYLGPAATARIAAAAPTRQAAAFARAWTAHEARLKSLGLQLAEWTPQLESQLARCQCRELALPAGFAGVIAWPG
jgi:4'-phosphopantetheinyl transferase